MKTEWSREDRFEGPDREAVVAFAQEGIESALDKRPDLREWFSNGKWRMKLVHTSGDRLSRNGKYTPAIEFDYGPRSWSRTTVKLRKDGTFNPDRVSECVNGIAMTNKSRHNANEVREANLKAWQEAGEPGGKNITITARPGFYDLRLSNGGLRFGERVRLERIAPICAALHEAARIVYAMSKEWMVYEALNHATHENQYPHEYDRPAREIVLEVNDWSSLPDFDHEDEAHISACVLEVERWRRDNPRPGS